MNNYFKDRMDEIQLRTEQMAERKTHESEIDSLEEKLKTLERDYDRLKTTYKSNLEQSALKRVELVVAKEMHSFAQDMLDKNRELLVEEKRKLDELHLKVWEEERKACDELDKCIAENDCVNFLNEYPLVLKTQKHALLAELESDPEIKRAVVEHPEIKRLAAEVTALEVEIKKTEDNCLSDDLQKVLTEKEKLSNNDNYKADEIQRLIEALEQSHRERMALEDEITNIESGKTEAHCGEAKLITSHKDAKDIHSVKIESRCNYSVVNSSYEEKLPQYVQATCDADESRAGKKQEKKLKAKKWYEEYAREVAASDEENYFKDLHSVVGQSRVLNIPNHGVVQDDSKDGCFFSSQSEPRGSKRETCLQREDEGVSEGKSSQTRTVKRKNSGEFLNPGNYSQPVKSRFFENKIKSSPVASGFLPATKLQKNLKQEKEDVDKKAEGSRRTPKAKIRQFQPLMATPSTFLNSRAETAPHTDSIQTGNRDEGPSTSSQSVRKSTKTVKFTPKRPSNVGTKSGYRQKKLEDFLNFMLPDNKYAIERK